MVGTPVNLARINAYGRGPDIEADHSPVCHKGGSTGHPHAERSRQSKEVAVGVKVQNKFSSRSPVQSLRNCVQYQWDRSHAPTIYERTSQVLRFLLCLGLLRPEGKASLAGAIGAEAELWAFYESSAAVAASIAIVGRNGHSAR